MPAFLRTLPGRLFILSSVLLAALLVTRQFVTLPEFVDLFRKVVRLAWLGSLIWLAVTAVASQSRRFLWRVRQKLILSYVFLGFVPVLLVLALSLAGGLVLYINVTAYMFHEGFADVADDVHQMAQNAAAEINRTPAAADDIIARRQASAVRYPRVTIALTPADNVPSWLRDAPGGFRGVIAEPTPGNRTDWMLIVRSVIPVPGQRRLVRVDVPIDEELVTAIEARSQTRMGQIFVPPGCGGSESQLSTNTGGMLNMFRQTVAFMDCTDWTTGHSERLSINLTAPLAKVWDNVVARSQGPGGLGPNQFLMVFVFLGVFFLIIQGAALFFGALLARSITYAVHELFVGTERIQQGDFAHRIRIESGDQLGDLAGQFNRMSASIEHLLHVQREKQRMDDELRIAREIQKSLLPPNPPAFAGLSIADLCEPAREVGGDYYDFFELGPRQLGVMIADVSGKGTSAALYMAELKGLMLAISQKERSPRRLLVEVNRLLSAHLDNRSFITMTYLVIDLDTRTVTCARAGHTPMIVASKGTTQVVAPSGMVLGLRLPSATERFEQLLEEHQQPLYPGDVLVLYTDGITEAMDADGELFSDESLARVIASHHRLDAAGIRERVVREVKAFVGDAEPHDDMTMIVLKVNEHAA